jgi:ATP-dependent Lon protease
MAKSVRSPIICLVGPPGVGKTSLAFSIAKAINRNFVKISVGGVNDESEIVGHRRTYLGANPGRIIQAMKKAKSSNPVFLIDEIDKMTKDYHGDPASALLEVLDPEQNKYFSDNYIEEEYDLSKVMFILTANYIEDIPEALKDRLEIVNLKGYTEYEKLDIVKKHLIPRVCKEHGIKKSKIIMSDENILYIIRNYTREAGVRELERQISTIVRKIVTEIVINKKYKDIYKLSKKDIIRYLGKEKYHFISTTSNEVGVVNGLAYTNYGGATLPIEVNFYPGKGDLVLTGSLGDVMKESARIALSYIKANHKFFGIKYNLLVENDIHIHFVEGAIPKDGPSAGIAITTALISALTNRKIDKTLAMTGEISLRGNVLPIGGLREKSIGALRKGIKTIIIPEENLKDLDEVPNEVKKKIVYLKVNNYKEVFEIIKSYKGELIKNGK